MHDARYADSQAPDRFGRWLRDLRISVTDRCNFRCRYCMPREVFGPDHVFLPRSELLTFEEITRLVRAFSRQGVRKIRLTGGEPLLRRQLDKLVAMLTEVDGIDDLALTTNASLLAAQARALRDAGLSRVTVSLDSLDADRFARISDTRVPLSRILQGIATAEEVGLAPIKINTVVKRGMNDGADLLELAEFGRAHGYTVRFIEYMDVGTTNGWRMDDVVPAREIVDRLHARWPVEPVDSDYPGEVAQRYRYRDGRGEVGIIASVTEPFCRTCTRARLSAQGELFTCLFAARGHDLRALVRGGADDAELERRIQAIWGRRTDRYSELRTTEANRARKVEMSYIGG
ncbi:GTP 3',8-cyclase MoaA [Saccharopolyspora phatthalungensis]|uniref:GTP 3',8-cyclase n=1 Tax=Saccharopolyspora phatthalungensis TaxID=664693 RepID=A0A840QIG3_9PSEU|nr:GTP 3',8-cyclase MoaA [Saccharopolyspora phatthalungensis]MBB5158658.1 cyclic pyranopterin phosphate synthase [Saccharopolyspora phatthalungensis]